MNIRVESATPKLVTIIARTFAKYTDRNAAEIESTIYDIIEQDNLAFDGAKRS